MNLKNLKKVEDSLETETNSKHSQALFKNEEKLLREQFSN